MVEDISWWVENEQILSHEGEGTTHHPPQQGKLCMLKTSFQDESVNLQKGKEKDYPRPARIMAF